MTKRHGKQVDPLPLSELAQHEGKLSDHELVGLLMSRGKLDQDLARRAVRFVRYNEDDARLWDDLLVASGIVSYTYGTPTRRRRRASRA